MHIGSGGAAYQRHATTSVLHTTPRWDELILFIQARPGVRVAHVLPNLEFAELRVMRELFPNDEYFPIILGGSTIGRPFDEVWVDVPITWENYKWFMESMMTRLTP